MTDYSTLNYDSCCSQTLNTLRIMNKAVLVHSGAQ